MSAASAAGIKSERRICHHNGGHEYQRKLHFRPEVEGELEAHLVSISGVPLWGLYRPNMPGVIGPEQHSCCSRPWEADRDPPTSVQLSHGTFAQSCWLTPVPPLAGEHEGRKLSLIAAGRGTRWRFDFRKSFKIAPGVRLSVGKKSGSVRIDPKGAGVTLGTKRNTVSASLPGTGLGVSSQSRGACAGAAVVMDVAILSASRFSVWHPS